MDFWEVLILAIVEGITEFLPVSSTGHLILTSKLLNIYQTEFVKTFEISIQLGAILSIVFLYGNRLVREKEVLKRVMWVFIPTAFLGFLFYAIIKNFLLGNLLITVWSLLIGGILIIFFERYFKKKEGKLKIKNLTLKRSLVLGVIQAISVIPGVSRSGATIFGGMFLGLSRKEATELSFMVALPVMAAATIYDLSKNLQSFSSSEMNILLFGMIASFIAAVIAVKWLVSYIKTHDFTYFGIYRIILSIFFFLFWV